MEFKNIKKIQHKKITEKVLDDVGYYEIFSSIGGKYSFSLYKLYYVYDGNEIKRVPPRYAICISGGVEANYGGTIVRQMVPKDKNYEVFLYEEEGDKGATLTVFH